MSKLDTFISVIVIGTCVIKAIAYGGSKPPTNEPPVGGDVLAAPQSTNNANSLCGDCGALGDRPLPSLTMVMLPPPSASTFNLNLITNWTRRGAYCDWKRIDLPDTFAFPSGTNLLTGVTLMSYGELRESLRGPVVANVFATSNQLPTTSYQLPTLSLEPDASSVSYGLTPSNSFVFVWENACVNREATNRVNAAIELFQNGDMCITTLTTNHQPLTTLFIPARPPEGFIGEGQDNNWATNAFPSAASNIVEKGYETWLMEDYVGINEPNGRYKVSVTIETLPENIPSYLVVGPHKIVVTQPGTYSFPLEVFTDYTARTYPIAVPLTIAYDEGYREDASATGAPAPLTTPRMTFAPNDNSNEVPVRMDPESHVSPPWMYCDEIGSTMVKLYWNVPNASTPTYTSDSGQTELSFVDRFSAWVLQAEVADYVYISYAADGHQGLALLRLVKRAMEVPSEPGHCAICLNENCPCNGICGIGCSCHTGTNTVHCIADPQ